MTLGDVLVFLLCLVLAAGLGILSQRILGFKLGGLIVSTFIGFVGALFGRELVRIFHLWEPIRLVIGGSAFPVMWCVIGGLLSTAAVGMIARKNPRKRKA